MSRVDRSTRWMRIAITGVAGALITNPAIVQAQDRAEYTMAADGAAKQRRKLDAADTKLIRLLHNRANDLGLDNYHVETTEILLKAWRIYTARECELIGQITGGQPVHRGTYAEICEERRYATREPVIEHVIGCLSSELKKPEDDRRATECLTVLTPLMVKGDYDA